MFAENVSYKPKVYCSRWARIRRPRQRKPHFLTLRLRLRRLPVLGGIRRGLRSALCALLLLVLLAHGTANGVEMLRRMLFRHAGAESLPELLECCFWVCAFIWHGQETSRLASSKQRVIRIRALS